MKLMLVIFALTVIVNVKGRYFIQFHIISYINIHPIPRLSALNLSYDLKLNMVFLSIVLGIKKP